ncbi:MAG TPA: hypothetical protein VFO17_07120 [Acidimicrobiia bacterium]|jgi:hypothetical protein|nr:hypothetical protein [Acidimicrobiia bacterium]
MFFVVGIMIGLNLMIRVVLGEVRELQSRGHASGGTARLTPGETVRITLKGLFFLVVFAGLGYLLDMAFDTTIDSLFG